MAKQITEAAAANNHQRVTVLPTRLEPLRSLFRKHGGSICVIATAAGFLGLTDTDCQPRPLQPFSAGDLADITRVIRVLGAEVIYPLDWQSAGPFETWQESNHHYMFETTSLGPVFAHSGPDNQPQRTTYIDSKRPPYV